MREFFLRMASDCARNRRGVNGEGSPKFMGLVYGATCLIAVLASGLWASAQVNVLTAHNDTARTGQNLNESILTPQNVNPNQFGKLFTQQTTYNGGIFAQPLYASRVAIPGKGTHNVVYVATKADYVYAFDADDNSGINANPLWRVSLLTNTTPAGTYKLAVQSGVYGTPYINRNTNTMYLVSSEVQGSNTVFRLHALDITSGAEKFGGPQSIKGSVPGTGVASVGGVLTFDENYQFQRAGLLLLNGVLYVPFGSLNDEGAWHGWIFSYNATTLKLIDIFCTAPNGTGDGVWMGGAGLAAEVNDPSKPYGRMFIVTGNGSFSASRPFTRSMSYGMSVLNLDLTGGVMTVQDEFTPYDWSLRDSQDADLGSGGVVLLPPQARGSGGTLNPLVQIGKPGRIYILDRNNLGGFNAAGDRVVQAVQTPESGAQNWGEGVWGDSAYWNQHIYFAGTSPGTSNTLKAYSFINGVLSTNPTSQSNEKFGYAGPTPVVSANGTENGIVWVWDTTAANTSGKGVLLAYNADNVSDLLYSSNMNAERDNPGSPDRFSVPTVANGKVYVGTTNQLVVFGLLTTPRTEPPVINPGSKSFSGLQVVTITDATPGAQIFYTTNGSMPTVNSQLCYGPITVKTNETINAMASATGYLESTTVSATYTSLGNTANPVVSLAAGAYSGAQSVTVTDNTEGAKIYYTVDGSTPTTGSPVYTRPLNIRVSETLRLLALAPGLLPSPVVTVSYQINEPYTFDFSQGFALAEGAIRFNGSTDLDDFRLQLTNGVSNEAGSAFYATPVNIQSFTTDFTFQLSNPAADGMTFTIQNNGPTMVGGVGGGLGSAGIGKSVSIKFDIYNNAGEGPNSTGLYIDGAVPTLPAINLAGTGIDLHSGDYMNAHITYDGINLNLTLTDALTRASWSHSFAVNIPAVVGGPTAYVGFTGGTGGLSASQKLTYWTYLAGAPPLPNYPAGFDRAGLTLNGSSALSGTALQLTNGGARETASAYFSTPVGITTFTSDFGFQLTEALADGFTFVIQNQGLTALGDPGNGEDLGYGGIPTSVAIKFDIYNNAGEGSDSTGVYVNGATPALPAINLANGTLQLSSGHVIHAHITYDGTTLTWTLNDKTTNAVATNSRAINIPDVVGSTTAYVGFTAASGGKTAIQNVLDWTLTNP
ncbi:T1SS secreted agglutinin RTX [Acidisarcina polymorpha]|uniref:T1SS secreted agglutinin RTX n=1 Tax=Acidisarcina polymorpha TaxID=2211140 RepID=A0A2Z5G3N7_9BACT|nr:chitobiase/beta-hexosaminidase C-terminal domain-containing protein [Acidisarcina polymorpha]AXC13689.1 T1SS secreted agglutinin RTX [Acidisarcina polymorpha]